MAGGPADEPALRYAGYFGTGTLAFLTGEVLRVPGGVADAVRERAAGVMTSASDVSGSPVTQR